MKLRPYIKSGSMMGYGIRSKIPLASNATKSEKEERINANRSMKKAYRHELKRETDNLIDEMFQQKGESGDVN